MYRCKNCDAVVPPNNSRNLVTLETRQVQYKFQNRFGEPLTTSGWEIAKEIPVCAKCYLVFTGKEVREVPAKSVFQRNKKPVEERTQEYTEPKPSRRPKTRKPIVEVVNRIQVVR